MIWFLGDILDKIKAVDLTNAKAPERPILSHARVIGVLPDELKRLHVLLSEAFDKRKRIEKETISSCEPTEDGLIFADRKYRAEFVHKILVACFWESVKDTFPEAAFVTIDVDENWQVVTNSPLPEESLSARFFASQDQADQDTRGNRGQG